MIAEELKLVVKSDVGKAVKDMSRFTGATEKTTDGFKKLALRIGATVASMYTLKKAFDFAQDAARIGAQTNQIRRALDNMARRAGTTADNIVRDMQEMSGNTIDQLQIMESSSKAALLGIPLERIGELMQVARASATALGTDVGQMFDDLATGIGRQSKMILDNLGINISAEKAYQDYAATLGKTSAQLSDTERRQAFLNAVLEDGKRIMEEVGKAGSEMTATEPWQMMKAAITDAKIALGEGLFPLFNKGALAVAKMVRDIIPYLENLPETFKAVGNLILAILRETFSFEMIKEWVIDMAIGWFNVWKTTLSHLPKLFWDAMRWASAPIESFITWLVEIFNSAWDRIHNAAVKAVGGLLEKVFGIEMEERMIRPIRGFREFYGDTVDLMIDRGKELGKELYSTLHDIVSENIKTLERLADNYADNPAIQAALEQLQTIKTEAAAAAAAMAEGAGTGGADPADDINNKLIPAYNGVIDVLKQMNREQIDVMTAIEVTAQRARDAAENDIIPAHEGIEGILKKLNREFIEHKSHIELVKEAYDELKEKSEEFADTAVNAMRPFTDALGQMFLDTSKGMEMFKEAMKNAIASMLEMLAKSAFAQMAYYLGLGTASLGVAANIPGAIALGAAGTGLMIAAGVVRGLKEGGIVTRPTPAVIGEAGPEAVIPLDKIKGLGGPQIVQNITVRGSVISQRELQRYAIGGLTKVARGY